ncbi:MAG: thiamine pyrophosphate-binding protein [Rhodobacteraceae bacterium]|nr:thiamine pyrophosphate-binding protein [Paracoccaceae bacterium]
MPTIEARAAAAGAREGGAGARPPAAPPAPGPAAAAPGAPAERAVHELLAAGLAAHGVGHLFGLIGDANLFMVDAFVRAGRGRYVACASEAAAVLAALGHAQAGGQTGVATITHGPALTNVATALVEGVRGALPVVILCGDTPPGDLQHLQRLDQRELVKATGAGFVELRSAATAQEDLARAFLAAAAGRRPVVLNMRVDLQWERAPALPPPVLPVPRPRPAPPEGAEFDDAMGIVAMARRPLVLAGRGATAPEARAAILALARRLEAPVATTLKAAGLFAGEDFDLGLFGTLSTPLAVETILGADCILSFGASLGRLTTAAGAYLRGRRVVQVVGDLEGEGRRAGPALTLVGDPALTARRMVELLDQAEVAPSGHAGPELRQGLAAAAAAFALPPAFAATRPGTVDLYPALRRLDAALPRDRVLVTDLGRFVSRAWKALPVTAPANLVYTANFAAIGCGLGEAVGAALAAPGRTTVLVAGDGGLLLGGLSDLATAVRERLDLVVILCNDQSYGAEHVQFVRRAMDPAVALTAPPDFAAIARAMGVAAVRVAAPADLAAAGAAIAARRGPVLVELRLDPDHLSAE